MNARGPKIDAEAYVEMIASRDHVRLPSRSREAVGHKEWFHFSVCTDAIDVLLNFSFVASEDDGAPPVGRLTWVVRTAGWVGAVRTAPAASTHVHVGEVACRLGADAFVFADGAFRVSTRDADAGVVIDLVLEPDALPALFHNVPTGDGAALHWFVAPKLRARGVVRVGGARFPIDGDAYHDHNWGRFQWGGDFAWEWGYAVSPDPSQAYAMVFSRMSDRAQHRTLRQGLFVWRDGVPTRVLRGARLEVRREGLLRAQNVLKLPSVMALRYAGTVTDVPQRLIVRARDGADRVDLVAHTEDVAVIMVPTDGDSGVTRIHEAVARVDVEGSLGGEPFAFSCRSVVELLRG